jgi:uncharacterized membrane protein YgcG
MLRLTVQVPEARDRTAVATLRAGLKTLATGPAVASATPAIAAARGNPACNPHRPWGHPALGGYRLLFQRATQPEQTAEYGSHFLLFEPESGDALAAESFGRLVLLAYGGPSGGDRRMRRTQGGLRLPNQMLHTAVARVAAGEEMILQLEPLAVPSWWQFWKQPAKTMPLSEAVPAAVAPPADELSIIDQLLKVAPVRRQRVRQDHEDNRDLDRRDDRSSLSSRSDGDGFQGRGGQFAGGGASGGWGETGTPRGPGVDHAGRIATGVAAGAALGALAGAAAASGTDDSTRTGETGGSDTVGSDSGGSDTSGSDSSGSGTATSTSY